VPNLKIAKQVDSRLASEEFSDLFPASDLARRLTAERPVLNVVELFAGAGGMGLGFLLANRPNTGFRLLFSGELEPVYSTTLHTNHDYLKRNSLVPEDRVPGFLDPIDLTNPASMDRIQAVARDWDGADVVIGGPPCQGFSAANRNSFSSRNPNNQLAEVFLHYVLRLRPKVFLMENVQGILWTPSRDGNGSLSVAEHVRNQALNAGYHLYPKLLDAAWYGVPQNRNRFFLVGIHQDLGYQKDAFGRWGPFPRPVHGPSGSKPYVTLREALGDLPRIVNGDDVDELAYADPDRVQNEFLSFVRAGTPRNVLWDHVLSKHADYVIERYRRIPPGSNWSAIADMMTNYAAIDRTHSNIYRRLVWDQPSITIGHYRKAMLIHPEQHRGLSLREAARLQSFPDWFRFSGNDQGPKKGMSYKQQQVANAVCPLVTKEIANLLLEL
jgi:DNA-cytosine methyltransferase